MDEGTSTPSAADTWFTEGRPDHPDFLRLADLVLQQDAESDHGFEVFVRNHLAENPMALLAAARREATMVRDETGNRSIEHAAHVAWVTGLAAGVRRHHPSVPELGERLVAGLDQASVEHMARQRVTRLLEQRASGRTARLATLTVAWLDGALVGLRI